MNGVSPSPNSPPAAIVQPLAPPPSTSPQPPPPATVPTPSSPPPPATVPTPSSPPPSPATVPTPSSPPPPPATVPTPSSPPPPATVPTPSSPPPSPATVPTQSSQPPPPSSPPPPATSPPPPSAPPLTSSPPQPSAPPLTSSPPPQLPPVTPPPLSNLPASSPASPSLRPPITSSPPPRNPPSPPPPRNPSSPPPPRNPPSSPPPSRSRTPPAPGPTRNSSPPAPRAPPPTPPRTPPAPGPTRNPSPPAPRAPPATRLSPPPRSDVSIPPPSNLNNNDSSPNIPSGNGGNGGIGIGGIVGIGAVIGVVLLMLIVLVSCCLIKRKKKIAEHNGLYNMSPRSDSGLLKIRPIAVETENQSANEFVYSPQFTYEDLVEATNGFSPLNLLGSGGFGFVYKGYLADGTEVAVKELKIGGGQGEREFSAEVEIISRIHHRHLVSLVGYCVSENKRLLVYEYVPNNTLHFHLHVSELVLDWPTRVKVASGAARGIAYLHEDCHPRIIHRDIKSSNILLDKNFEARVSDFGLAKLAADMCTHVTTRVMGTFGYMAPEYASSGVLTEKSDVFSYGVVLLELITGRKSVDVSQPLGDEGLVEWARPLLSHALETEDFKVLVDQRLGTNFVASEMFRMIEAAAACIRHSATRRPRMGQIVRAFESPEIEDLSNGMKVGQSEIYSSGQQSAEISLFRKMEFGSQNYSTDYFTQGSATSYSNER